MDLHRSLPYAVAVFAFAAGASGQIAPTTRENPPGATEPTSAASAVPPRLVHFVQAAYPPEALDQGLDGAVLLQLSVDATGRVTDAAVVEGLGHGLDEAAVAAARRFEFQPAQRDGAPVPAILRYRYRFNAAAARAALQPAVRAVFRGVVRGPGERALQGANIHATLPGGIPRDQVTDAAGGFRFELTAAGAVDLSITADGYTPVQATETVGDREDASAIFRLTPVPARPAGGQVRPTEASDEDVGEAVVRARRPAREVTRQVLDLREIQRMPGTGGDALRAVQNFPGVARSVTGLLIVRGSTPNDTQIFADGTSLPLVYHFFGLSSVVNTELLDHIDFYPGNFSARYGRAQGGIVDLGLRTPRSEGYHAVANINLIDASVFVEGAITRQLSFALSVRRSYVDVILGAALNGANVQLTTAPRYYDYQGILDYHPTRRDHVRLAVLGSDDQFAIVNSKPNDMAPRFTGEFSTAIGFNTGQLLWEHTFSPGVSSRAVASVGRNALSLSAGAVFGIDLAFWQYTFRYELQWQASRMLRANFGVDILGGPATITLNGARTPTEGQTFNTSAIVRTAADTTGTLYRPAVYAEMELTPTPQVRFIPGLRVDYARDANRTATVSPRLAFRWEFAHDWFLKGGMGIFTQPPQPQESSNATNLFNPSGTLGNPFLLQQRAVQYSAGLERTFSQYVSVSAEGFYKTLDNQVVANTNPLAEPYTNGGTGRIYGAEILLRHRPSRRFFGWVAYTLSRSERRDPGQADYRLFQFDQTHILTVIGSYRLGRGWEVGARFRYVTGSPVTPYVGAYLDGNTGTYTPIPGPTLSARNDPFHQLDIRVDKTWTFTRWNLDLYLEVLNVYNRVNPEGVQYNYNYTQSAVVGGIPFFPNLGLRGEF